MERTKDNRILWTRKDQDIYNIKLKGLRATALRIKRIIEISGIEMREVYAINTKEIQILLSVSKQTVLKGIKQLVSRGFIKDIEEIKEDFISFKPTKYFNTIITVYSSEGQTVFKDNKNYLYLVEISPSINKGE